MSKHGSSSFNIYTALEIALFPAVFLYDELLLRAFSGGSISHSLWTVLAAAGAAGLFAAFLTSFGKAPVRRAVRGILLLLSAVWFITQTLLNRVYAMYFSPATIGTGAEGVASEYADMVQRTVLLGIPVILLYLLPLFLYLAVCVRSRKHPAENVPQVSKRAAAIRTGALLCCALVLHFAVVYTGKTGRDSDLYTSAYTFDNATRAFGLLTSTRLDVQHLILGTGEADAFDLESEFSYTEFPTTGMVSENTVSEDAVSEGAVSEDAVSGTVAAAETAAADSVSDYSEVPGHSETGSSDDSESSTSASSAAVSSALSESSISASSADLESAISASSGNLESAISASSGNLESAISASSGDLESSMSVVSEHTESSVSASSAVSEISETSDSSFSAVSRNSALTKTGPLVMKAPEVHEEDDTAAHALHDRQEVSFGETARKDMEDHGEKTGAEAEAVSAPADRDEALAESASGELEAEKTSESASEERQEETHFFAEKTGEPLKPEDMEPNAMDLDFAQIAASSSGAASAISEYAATLTPSRKNRYTGIFQGKNLILICAEAYNDSFVSKELTPTLWRLSHNGFWFSDFYQPAWGGSTSTGEFSMLFGLAPQNSAGTIRQTQNSNNYFTMGNQLQRLGYHSWAFHNGTYTYYDRDKTHKNLGYDEWIAMGSGMEKLSGGKYLNDEEMFDVTMDLYMDQQPFSVYYMSISGHAPYSNPDDSKVTSHIDRVKEVLGDHFDDFSQNTIDYICYQLVLEDALTLMVSRLEEAGILDDTVIAMTGDHYPYGLRGSEWGNSEDNVKNLVGHEADTPWGLDKTGCIIWSGCLETEYRDLAAEIAAPTYSLDMLPTLSNLFGLEYDSRLLIGRDVFSDEMPLVLWNNGSWITARGRYNARTGIYEPAETYQNTEEKPASPAAAAEEAAAEGSKASGETDSAADTGSQKNTLSADTGSGLPEEDGLLILRHSGMDYADYLLTSAESREMENLPVLQPPSGVDPAALGPEDEKEYTEWVRSLVMNRLSFSKQVIDTNYYETLFGKDDVGVR